MIKNLFIDVNNSITHDQGKVKMTAMSYYIKVDDKLESSFLVQSALLGWLGVDAAKALWRYGTMALWNYGNKV